MVMDAPSSTASPTFSVVIPALNEGRMLHMTVENVLRQSGSPSFEVVIVDDGSSDGSADRYRGCGERVRVVDGGQLGVARARNLGAQHALGEHLVFLDAHCRVSPGWLDRFAAALADPDVAIAGPAFTRLWQSEPRAAGMTWINDMLDLAWFLVPDAGDAPYEVPISPGGCQAFRASTFRQLGGYEECFARWGCEDVEVCMRAWMLGYRVVVDPSITVAHFFRETRDFDVADEDVLFNLLLLAELHFSPARRDRFVALLGDQPHLATAQRQLALSDAAHRRAHLDARRLHDDAWFLARFAPEILRAVG